MQIKQKPWAWEIKAEHRRPIAVPIILLGNRILEAVWGKWLKVINSTVKNQTKRNILFLQLSRIFDFLPSDNRKKLRFRNSAFNLINWIQHMAQEMTSREGYCYNRWPDMARHFAQGIVTTDILIFEFPWTRHENGPPQGSPASLGPASRPMRWRRCGPRCRPPSPTAFGKEGVPFLLSGTSPPGGIVTLLCSHPFSPWEHNIMADTVLFEKMKVPKPFNVSKGMFLSF